MKFEIMLDETGFPLIKSSSWDFFISIYPVSKYQFESFLCKCPRRIRTIYTDSWYRQLLNKNPRCAWHAVNNEPWRHFLSGESPEYFEEFINYCGRGMRLPTIAEWRQLLNVERQICENLEKLRQACQEAVLPVRYWLQQGLCILTSEGMLEFVQAQASSTTTIIGRPFTAYHSNLWAPDREREIRKDSKLWNIVSFRLALSK